MVRVPEQTELNGLNAKDALKLVKKGTAPAGMKVRGRLEIQKSVKALPEGLEVDTLDLTNAFHLASLPSGLRARRVILQGHHSAQHLISGLSCAELDLSRTAVTELPDDLRVEKRLNLEECRRLVTLPAGLRVGVLNLVGCSSLRALPEGLETNFLDITGCAALESWPSQGRVEVGRLRARGCRWITSLPSWIGPLAQLDLRDCANLATLPPGLRVASWIDIAGTGITALPESLQGVGLRWRGVSVEERIIFRPETITVEEVLGERNTERRRVLVERMGYDRFFEQAKAKVLDQDTDRGGERRLLRVNLEGDEPLVCVAVVCPSTGRRYMIRVPPRTRSCRQAAAWVAGFDKESDYQPLIET